MDGGIVANAVEAHEVGQIDIIDQLAQPGGVADGGSGTGYVEGILGGVPELGVHIGLGGGSDVAHGSSSGVRGDGKAGHTGVHGVEHILLVLGMECMGGEQEQQGCKDSVHLIVVLHIG